MTINLSFRAELDACPDCGREQEFSGINATCRACNYHAGAELSQQWLDYCESLTMPNGVSLDFCHEAENGSDYYIEVSVSRWANEAEMRNWVGEIGGTVEEGDLLAAILGCANSMAPATEGDIAQVILACECTIGGPTFYQLPESAREDTQRTLGVAHEAEAALGAGKTVWFGNDDDGYYFRIVVEAGVAAR